MRFLEGVLIVFSLSLTRKNTYEAVLHYVNVFYRASNPWAAKYCVGSLRKPSKSGLAATSLCIITWDHGEPEKRVLFPFPVPVPFPLFPAACA